MIIKSIKLTNFRNHHDYYLECTENTSLILGENGCGKTSVLEAIYILTRGRSFRATDGDILKRGEKYYRIEIEYWSGEKNIATYDGKNKTFIVLDKKTRRLPKRNKYPVILFLPSDLNLISHSPSRRREYFDKIFSQLDENYNQYLLKYEKALKQRNDLLKKEPSLNDLFSWNLLLSNYGTNLFKFRKKIIQEINDKLTTTYRSIAKNEDKVKIDYTSEIEGLSESDYLKKLESNYERDCVLGHTGFGIHRDEYLFIFNDKLANGSASRGETRSIILALKFIEAELIDQTLHLKPIILLDDVFSELDETRRKCLVENFKNNQVIITSVENVNEN